MRFVPMPTDLRGILKGVTIEASAPGRIDCGGGWDLKGLAITHEAIRPSTVNLALTLRTTVSLESGDEGMVCVAADGVGTRAHAKPLPFTGPLELIFAVVSHFDVSGVKLTIASDIPPRSGLGGSGVLAVALIAALSKALSLADGRTLPAGHDIALLAHHLEDGLQISHTGLQDQLAAAYGGVNRWVWRYSDFARPYRREVLLPPERIAELAGRVLVAYSGVTHDSKALIARWVQSFRQPEHRGSWYEINAGTHVLSEAIRRALWGAAGSALSQEAAAWDRVCPQVWAPLTSRLRAVAEEHGCGARFTGAGGGGCVWAIGDLDPIARTRQAWEGILRQTGSGRLLTSEVTDRGLSITVRT
jgi:D-glycero-alpha-D-manno-heptose-7-phosphate kinase